MPSNQFVIIDKLSLDFQSGLTVLTGETGAGKSILLDAMGIILGEAPDVEAIREKSEESSIEAMFAPPPAHPVWKLLAERDVPAMGHDITVHRTIGRTGKDEIMRQRKNHRARCVEGNPAPTSSKFTARTPIRSAFAGARQRQLSLARCLRRLPARIFTSKNVSNDWHAFFFATPKGGGRRKNFHRAPRAMNSRRSNALIGDMPKIEIRAGLYEETKAEYYKLLNSKETMEIFQSIQAQLVAGSGAEQALVKANRTVGQQQARLMGICWTPC